MSGFRTIIFFIITACLTEFTLAIDFKRLAPEDGLSSSFVFSISQDKKGLIWIVTRAGIDSYDGSKFYHYELKPDSTSPSAQGRQVLYDVNNKLWVGTTNGLFKYNEVKDAFELASDKFLNDQNSRIFKLQTDSKSQLWIGASNSLFVLNPDLDSLIRIPEINLTVNDILCLNNQFTIVSTIRGIYKISTSDLSISPISAVGSINDTFSNEFISALHLDNNGRIWVAVLNKGLYIYDPVNESIKHLKSLQKFLEPGIVISNIKSINSTEFLIATDGNGLLILNDDYSVKEHIVYIEDNTRSLSTNGVRDLFIDAENRIWVSTYGGGASLFDPYIQPFNRIEHIPNNLNSIINNSGNAVIEDKFKRLWFGTKKGISVYSPDENKWEHVYNTANNLDILGQNNIKSFCMVSQDEIWVGNYGGGIDCINTKTLEARPVFPRNKIESILGSSYVFAVFKCSEEDIWISTLRSQMVRFNPKTNSISYYPIKDIQQIEENKSGELVISSKHGLYILNKAAGESEHYYRIPNDPSSLSSTEICATLVDYDGKIYIGTEAGGLNIFYPENKKFVHYTKEDGLPSNWIYGIEKDLSGMIWLSTSQGISMFDPINKSFTNYDSSEGLHINEFIQGSSCITSEGMILFGGINGFVSFFPEQIKKSSIPPKLIFSDFKISNLPVKIDSENGPLKGAIDLTDTLFLKYRQRSFSISFSGINYTNPINNQYSWKLEGFEDDWTPRAKDNTASYTNISPGYYNFFVRSTNLQDDWNGNERRIVIRIKPPFYLTYWALIIYLTIITSIAALIFNDLKIRYQEKRAKEKVDFFINLSHDLRTPLTLIQSPLSKLLENNSLNDADKQYLNLSQRNAGKLTQLFNQLLDFQKADMQKMQLQVAEYDIVEHVRNVIRAFNPMLEKKRIECILYTSSEKLFVWFDMLIMDKVLYNLLSNAIKYNKDNGKIDISIKSVNNLCLIEVKDYGIGIPLEQQKKIFKSYFRATNAINSAETGSGVGLMLIKQLIELHKGKVDFESKPDAGTTFKIRIPIKSNDYTTTDYLNNTIIDGMKISKTSLSHIPEIVYDQETLSDDTDGSTLKKPKIVIAEDNNELRYFLIDSLKPHYRVFGAPDGREALSLIEKNHPDIIISDIMMPEMDGTTLCIHLKRYIETCHIPVILLTALTDTDYKIEGYEVGADAYLEKPFDIKVLKSRIENLLKSRELLREKFLKYGEPTEKINFKSKIDQEFIQKVVQIVHENISDSEFSVERLCKMIYMSRPVLYRKLKALLNQSPQDFIKIIRLKKAVEFLQQSNMNITEIAYSTGFSDSKYFTTCFKKHFGVSPSKYIS